ncbi:hypothetical protein [Mucilaginibacter sp.]|uniref:hypothetical protein n=1 Tax=Mucilaginibacter sp. TaxID=1882438 RepID=UPI0032637E53
MNNTYKLTSGKLDGYIELEYTSGLLTRISIAIKQGLNDKQFSWLISAITQHEHQVRQLEEIGITVSAAMPANQKLALFCRLYELYKKIKYKVSPADSGKIKLITIDEPMLVAYFTSENFIFKNKHSVSNLVRYYNELRAEIAKSSKPAHPDYWSDKHASKLDGKARAAYIGHLHSIGLKPVYLLNGDVKDWVKKQ